MMSKFTDAKLALSEWFLRRWDVLLVDAETVEPDENLPGSPHWTAEEISRIRGSPRSEE